MRLTVGEISKVLGLTTENIRYYVREGLIKPEKNKDNNYWEYSSDDVMYISDILFYRSMGISIDNIRKIFSGIPLESIGEVIDDTISELIGKIKEYTFLLESIQGWQKEYNLELSEIGQYKKGKMPPSGGRGRKREQESRKRAQEKEANKPSQKNMRQNNR